MPPKKNLWFDRLTILSEVEGKLSAVRLPACAEASAGRHRLSVIRRLLRSLRSRIAEFSRGDFQVYCNFLEQLDG